MKPGSTGLFRRRSVSWGLKLGLALILIVLSWRSINYISGSHPLTDSSVFSGAARHMIEGKTLYTDVWDHKPPMIYIINYWAMKAGGCSINSVRYAERIFSVFGCLFVFMTGLLAFRKAGAAFVCGIFYLMHMYFPWTFEGGNLTEEYGAVFMIGGIASAIAVELVHVKFKVCLSALSGILFSLAVLCKEPFLLIAIPWFVYLVRPVKGKIRQSVLNGLMFVLGGVLPVLCVILWLWHSGALNDWINTIIYNFSYSSSGSENNSFTKCFSNLNMKMMSALFITQVLAVIGILCLIDFKFVKKYNYLPLFFLISVLISLFCTTLSGKYFGHYYMMLVPGYILMGMGAMVYVWEKIKAIQIQKWRIFLSAILLYIVVLVCWLADDPKYISFSRRIAAPAQRWQGDSVTQFVLKNTVPDDRIWAPRDPFISLYAETGRLSPTKWFFLNDDCLSSTPARTNAQKVRMLRSQIEKDPPKYVFINRWGLNILEKNGLLGWFTNRFKLIYEQANPNLMTLQIWQPVEPAQ